VLRAVPKVTPKLDTAGLVRRVQRGDKTAFSALVRAFLRPAYAVALAVLGRRADAEDVAQDAFIVALERIDGCRHPERFAGWLLTIVRNRALNRLEERRLRDVPAAAGAPQGVVAAGDAARIGLEERLCAALGALSAAQREVVLLHDLEEWTHAEIAAALEVSEGMSRQHLFQARQKLRARLSEADHEP
jgi:RNA polymerase sigma-70 factor (ECF subfamily)